MTTLILLALAGVVGMPQYFRQVRGSSNQWLHLTTVLQLALLAAAALVAAGGGGPPVAWPAAATLAVATAAVGGGPVTMSILRLSERTDAADLHDQAGAVRAADSAFGAEPDAATTATEAPGPVTLRGGAWIGVLERTAISATLWCGWPEGLAIVLAVKGLGRYAELGKEGAAERFILGTFASVLWACACTGIGVLATA